MKRMKAAVTCGMVCFPECMAKTIRPHPKLKWMYVRRSQYGAGDEYIFLIDTNGRIRAGCRNFTIRQAEKHWGSPDYPDPKLGKESLRIVKKLVEQVRGKR